MFSAGEIEVRTQGATFTVVDPEGVLGAEARLRKIDEDGNDDGSVSVEDFCFGRSCGSDVDYMNLNQFVAGALIVGDTPADNFRRGGVRDFLDLLPQLNQFNNLISFARHSLTERNGETVRNGNYLDPRKANMFEMDKEAGRELQAMYTQADSVASKLYYSLNKMLGVVDQPLSPAVDACGTARSMTFAGAQLPEYLATEILLATERYTQNVTWLQDNDIRLTCEGHSIVAGKFYWTPGAESSGLNRQFIPLIASDENDYETEGCHGSWR